MLTLEVSWHDQVRSLTLQSNATEQVPPMRAFREWASSPKTEKFVLHVTGFDITKACSMLNVPELPVRQTFFGDHARYILANWPLQPSDTDERKMEWQDDST